ncbi:FecR domain-containing protein [Candidatus Latescibacterota bacterium]
MKQPILNLFLLCVAFLIVNSYSMIGTKKVESIVGTWNGKSPRELDVTAVVFRINGTLEFRRTSSDDWASAKVKDQLPNGYQLRTQTGDRAIIIYTSGTRVFINENTHIEIQADIARPGEIPSMERTKIIYGEISNRVKGDYEVETPSSVASVRDTEFNLSSTFWKTDDTILVKVQSKMESIQVKSSTFSTEIENLSVNPK